VFYPKLELIKATLWLKSVSAAIVFTEDFQQ